MSGTNDEPRATLGGRSGHGTNENRSQTHSTLLAAYSKAGLFLVGIPKVNGKPEKGPTRKGWNLAQSDNNPDGYTDNPDQWAEWLDRGCNIGLAHRPSGTMALDIDSLEETRRVFSDAGLPLDQWLNDPASVHFLSGKPGKEKLIFRLPDGVSLPTVQLSWKVDGREVSIFELRNSSKGGETVQDVAPPSTHKDTLKPYKLVGDITAIPPIPPELLGVFQNWQEWKPFFLTRAPGWEPPTEKPKPRGRPAKAIDGERDAVAEFNATYALEDVLTRNGYKRRGERFIRPGSDSSNPGIVVFDNGNCYSHGSDGLKNGYPHDAFDVFRILECGGSKPLAMAWNPELTKENQRAYMRGRADKAKPVNERTSTVPEAYQSDIPPIPEDEDFYRGVPEKVDRRRLNPPRDKANPQAKPIPPISPMPPSRRELTLTDDEINNARLTPDCIVEEYLYADVAVLCAPGGTGKTTQFIHEAVCIALGLPVWGMAVRKTGWTLIVTAEDSREVLAARLREILSHMGLDGSQRRTAIEGVVIWDITGEATKLITASDGNLVLTGLADNIVTAYRSDPPVLINFDPLISFGADESRVNDNEQALITAARRIVRGLGCCTRLVHHVGKGNAREKSLDQYSARGGSALPDGSRMTTILQAWDDNQREPLPQGCTTGEKIGITALARAKLSYARPNLPIIFIRREGWKFEHFTERPKQSKAELRAAHADQLERYLASEVGQGRYPNKSSLEELCGDLDMKRNEVRAALTSLEVQGRVIEIELPKHLKQGRKQTYLSPFNSAEPFGDIGQKDTKTAHPDEPIPPSSLIPPPYRKINGGDIEAAILSPVDLNSAALFGGIGGIGGIGEQPHNKPVNPDDEESRIDAMVADLERMRADRMEGKP